MKPLLASEVILLKVATVVHHNTVQPGREFGLKAKTGKCPIDLYKDVLCGFFGQGCVVKLVVALGIDLMLPP